LNSFGLIFDYLLNFRTLHEGELWFHSRIGRQEAEIRLKNAGGKSGLFL